MLAGDVTAILGAKVNPAGFAAYDAAIGRATASAARAEAVQTKHTAAMTSGGVAASRFGAAAKTGAAAGAIVLAAAMAKSVSVAADFETQMDRVKAVTQASGRDMKAMTTIARDLGKKTGLGATEAARGLEALAKGGLSTKQIIGGGLAGALALAQAGSMDVAAAAETTANALNLFGLSGSQATHVADAMATAANATTADVSDFAMALTQAGAAAKVSGLSFDETIVALESLAKIGVKGSDAGTSLKAALLQTINPTDQAAAAMKRYGIDFTDAQGKMKPLGDVAEMLQTKLGGLTKEQKIAALQAMAGTDGFRALAALMEQGGEGVDRLQGGLKKQGEAARVAKENTDNLNGAWDRFKAQLQDLAIVAGTPLLEGLTDGLNAINGWLDDLGDNQDVQQFVDDLGKIAGAIGDVLDMMDAGQAVGEMFSGWGDQIAGLTHALASLVEGDFEGFKAGMRQFGEGAVRAFVAPWKSVAKGIVTPIAGAVSSVLGLFQSLVGGMASVWGALAKVPGPMQGMFKAAEAAAKGAEGAIKRLRGEVDKLKPKKPKIDIDVDKAVAALQQIRDTKIEPKVMKILGSDDSAKSKIKQLIALGIPPKTARLLANISDVQGKTKTAQGMINRVRGKTLRIDAGGNALGTLQSIAQQLAGIRSKTVSVTVNTTNRAYKDPRLRASGRAAGAPELALVGEGRNPREAVVSPSGGWSMVTQGPMVMPLPADAYVIPEDPAYRGRALGFLGMLADDLGLRGFKKGKAPAKNKPAAKKSGPLGLPDPQDLKPTSLPLADLRDRESVAERKRDDAKGRVEDLDRKSKDKGRDGKLTKEAKAARGKLGDARRAKAARQKELDRLRKLRQQAERYQAAIEKAETLANTAATEMRTANQRGDRAGWDAAKGRRAKALGTLAELLKKAQGALRDQDSQAAADLAQSIAENESAVQELGSDAFDVPDPATDEALTDEQKRRLAELDRDVALAALTEGIGDDLSSAQARESFLTDLLNGAIGQGRSAEVVGDLATMVKQARDNVASFSSSSSSNENADLQAQIEQQRARADLAEQNARLNAQALRTFTGPGDIGTGGGGVNLTINTLHPGDPRTLTAIGQAAAAGFGFQGGISSPRTAVG